MINTDKLSKEALVMSSTIVVVALKKILAQIIITHCSGAIVFFYQF